MSNRFFAAGLQDCSAASRNSLILKHPAGADRKKPSRKSLETERAKQANTQPAKPAQALPHGQIDERTSDAHQTRVPIRSRSALIRPRDAET